LSGGRGSTHRHQRRRPIAQTANGKPGKKAAMPSVMRSVVAANVDPSVIIRQHVTVVAVPMVGVPNPRNEAMEVPRVNTAVTDPGETVIASDAVPQWASARDATARQPIASCAPAHKRLAGDAAMRTRVATGHSAAGKPGPPLMPRQPPGHPSPKISTTTATNDHHHERRVYQTCNDFKGCPAFRALGPAIAIAIADAPNRCASVSYILGRSLSG
jgi:hypothetical protein